MLCFQGYAFLRAVDEGAGLTHERRQVSFVSSLPWASPGPSLKVFVLSAEVPTALDDSSGSKRLGIGDRAAGD